MHAECVQNVTMITGAKIYTITKKSRGESAERLNIFTARIAATK